MVITMNTVVRVTSCVEPIDPHTSAVTLPHIETLFCHESGWSQIGLDFGGEVMWEYDHKTTTKVPGLLVHVYEDFSTPKSPRTLRAMYSYAIAPDECIRMSCMDRFGIALNEFHVSDEISLGGQVAFSTYDGDIELGRMFPSTFTLRLKELLIADAFLRFKYDPESPCKPYPQELVIPEGFVVPPRWHPTDYGF